MCVIGSIQIIDASSVSPFLPSLLSYSSRMLAYQATSALLGSRCYFRVQSRKNKRRVTKEKRREATRKQNSSNIYKNEKERELVYENETAMRSTCSIDLISRQEESMEQLSFFLPFLFSPFWCHFCSTILEPYLHVLEHKTTAHTSYNHLLLVNVLR